MRQKAIWRLVLSTAAWGLSFPAAKAVMQAQALLLPDRPEWFHAAFILFNRMLIATVVMLLLLRSRMRGLTRTELRQGMELGLFGGLGMLLQTDAQNYIAASTSAFFTQFTCVFIPLTIALRSRRAPTGSVVASALLVMTGCAVLSGVQLGGIAFGRGEWETIAAAVLFTAQILCLERAEFHGTDSMRTATIMFAMKGTILLPFVLAGCGGIATLAAPYTSPSVLGLSALLAIVCTAYAYSAMTHWQRYVTSTQAGLIYATEPVFASVWALFLPGLFSTLAGLHYANEQLHWQLFAGGTLILAANLLLILHPPKAVEPPPFAHP